MRVLTNSFAVRQDQGFDVYSVCQNSFPKWWRFPAGNRGKPAGLSHHFGNEFWQPIYTLNNEKVEVAVVPELGAKIISVKDRRTKREWMWHPSHGPILFHNRPGDDFFNSPLVGMDECLPTIDPCEWAGRNLPDHGEVWSAAWDVNEDAWQKGALKTSVRLQISPFNFERTIELEDNEICLSYQLSNQNSEPEMVNPKSELFEKHPDWIIRQPKRELELQRNQLVLDLTRPAVQDFEWNTIKGILSEPNISYAKWDCNRYLTQPGSSYLPADRQSELGIDYVRALYALMEKTAKTFPNTELMLCSGGGGRVDYGALKYFHEFWPSDNTDPVSRVPMQWDYSYFFPPTAWAGHVTHWGNRPTHFACSVAMSGRFGMDLDLNKLSAEDKAVCAGAIRAYKEIRGLTSLGDLYRLEDPHENFRGALNFVSPDRRRAVLFAFQLEEGANRPVFPQGLNAEQQYTVRELNRAPGREAISQEGKTFTGSELMRDGIMPSCSKTLEASVIELTP